MGQYLPFAGEHSIQEAVVGIHFHGEPDSKVVRQARDTAQAELADVLPRYQDIHQIEEMRIGQDAVVQDSGSHRLAGFERSKVKADATPARVLRLFEKDLTVNFLDYPGWDAAFEDGLGYLRTVLPPLNLAANPVMAVSLRYIDRYTFDGPDDAPHAEMLLRKGNAYVTPYSFSAGPFWHSHSGWFETLEGGARVLNQVNVGSTLVDQAPTITIDHNAICQLKAPRQSANTPFQSSDDSAGMKGLMDILHDRNLAVLRDMLQPAMKTRIGLQK